jgi:anti-sigma factor RsiW
MNCDEVGRSLVAYVDGELDLTRQLKVETHLASCFSCRDLAEEMTHFCSIVQMNTAVYKVPRELKAKI